MALVQQADPETEEDYYDLLGVDEEADIEKLTAAYRQRALEEHPDKGGDADRFHEIAKAFKVLSNPDSRNAYNDELAKARERARLVEGAPGGMSTKQAQAPMPRQKTAPMPGSKRQGKLRCGQPGNYNACAEEWKNMGSAARILLAITDDVTPEQKTEQLMDKYASLPKGKDKKREWVSGLRGKEKQDLKQVAKKREEAERTKWASNWLNPAMQAAKAGDKAAQKKPPPPKKAAAPPAAERASAQLSSTATDSAKIEPASCAAEIKDKDDLSQGFGGVTLSA